MYSGPELPLTGGGLFVTGMAINQLLWLGVAIVVVGGALLAVANLAPRVAVESLTDGTDRRRLVLTVNGHERFVLRRLIRR